MLSGRSGKPRASPWAAVLTLALGIGVSDDLWRRLFNGDSGIVGRTVALNGQTFTIVGVAPRGFEGIVRGQRADLWASVSQFFPLRHRPDLLDSRETSWLNLLGRLAPGVSAAQVQVV